MFHGSGLRVKDSVSVEGSNYSTRPVLSSGCEWDYDVWGATLVRRCVPYMCSGSEAGSYLRLIDFVYHSALGLRGTKKKRRRSSPLQVARTCNESKVEEENLSEPSGTPLNN